jgi:hypothetical protein
MSRPIKVSAGMVGRVAGWNLRIQLKIMKAITNRLKTIVVTTKDPGTLAELQGTHIFFSSPAEEDVPN